MRRVARWLWRNPLVALVYPAYAAGLIGDSGEWVPVIVAWTLMGYVGFRSIGFRCR